MATKAKNIQRAVRAEKTDLNQTASGRDPRWAAKKAAGNRRDRDQYGRASWNNSTR